LLFDCTKNPFKSQLLLNVNKYVKIAKIIFRGFKIIVKTAKMLGKYMNLAITPNFTPKMYKNQNQPKRDISFGEAYCVVLAKNDSILNRAALLVKGFLANSSQNMKVVFEKGFLSNKIIFLPNGAPENLSSVPARIQKKVVKKELSNIKRQNVIRPQTDADLINFMEKIK